MAQSFSFGFGGEDLDDVEDEVSANAENLSDPPVECGGPLNEPQLHTLEELLSHLPSSITCTSHHVAQNGADIDAICLPRRDLFDIRAQVMAEVDPSSLDSSATAGLLSDDILSRVYEGGFKTWECSVDLARYIFNLLATEQLVLRGMDTCIIELGAGTALPTATLLHHLASVSPSSRSTRTHITVADYNAQVLALATIPNLLLTLLSTQTPSHPWPTEGDLDVSPAMTSRFATALHDRGIHISAISGAWGPAFASLISSTAIDRRANDDNATTAHRPTVTLILASETIYSPASTRAFTQTVLALLKANSAGPAQRAVALVAAKRVYFGVGGGVDEFLAVLAEMGGSARCVWDSSEARAGRHGVGRCILEVGLQPVGQEL
ncbi:hypothetical protein MMC26_000252 [Xylographa opegraphella]|nr:hypothetical protein [Xylographa opegraphella]